MAAECIFCQIVAGEAEASFAYEDDATMAFVDLRQFHAGHTLVVPRRHIRDIYGLDEKTGSALMAAISRVAEAVREAFQPDGINVWQSNGEPWQEVFHLHFHCCPVGEGMDSCASLRHRATSLRAMNWTIRPQKSAPRLPVNRRRSG